MEPASRQILILSADAELRDWLVQSARSVDASLVACEAVDKALEEIKRREVSLIVVALPVTGGESWEDLVGRVRKFREDLGFVLVSGRVDQQILLPALRLGVLDHLTVSERSSDEAKEVVSRLNHALHRTRGVRESIGVLRELRSVVDDFMEHMLKADQEYRDLKTRMSETGQVDAPRGNILFVEDDEQVARTASDAMGAEGYQVSFVANGGQAVKAAETTDFQAVVLEQTLPDMGGLELMRLLRTMQPDADYIFIVGFTEADSAVLALRSGASAFMIKPYAAQDLVTRVKELTTRGELKRRSREYFEDFRRKYQGFLDKYENLIAKLQHHTP